MILSRVMPKPNVKSLTVLLIVLSAIIFPLYFFSIQTKADDIMLLNGYAWSSNIGWISFSCANENPQTCEDQPGYQVKVDLTDGKFSGYAWSSNIGWINFAPVGPYPQAPSRGATLTVVPSSTCASGKQIQGWARALSYGGGWDGWIKMAGTATNGTQYGVCMTSDGKAFQGWAWGGGNSSNLIGWVQFDPSYNELSKEPKLIEIRPQ